MDLRKELTQIAQVAKSSYYSLGSISSETKNKILIDMAEALQRNKDFILKNNLVDIKEAQKKKVSASLVDRLTLNDKRIKEMSDSLVEIANLADPIGEVIKAWKTKNNLWINKVRVPIGVILIIYESRPNVTSDCIGLCLKSSNAVILKGGSEAINSNRAIYRILNEVIQNYKLPQGLINFIDYTEHQAVNILLKMDKYIDLVIPRGGEGLIRQVQKLSRIPVIKHYKGVCHIYVDEYADLNMAEKICFNAKVQRPATCNAMETLLVHQDVAARFLPGMIKKFREANVEVRGCSISRSIVKDIKPIREKDFYNEYLDLILSLKVVKNLEEAIKHINHYGSAHSDAIVTDNYQNALEFLNRVDSACVYVNASTRFTDGYQFGLGAEIGISTDKLHARGPMALEELTTYKYIVFGNGQIRT